MPVQDGYVPRDMLDLRPVEGRKGRVQQAESAGEGTVQLQCYTSECYPRKAAEELPQEFHEVDMTMENLMS